jgi:ABC-type ATPase involved in cell division
MQTDEPTSNLDTRTSREIMDLIMSLAIGVTRFSAP